MKKQLLKVLTILFSGLFLLNTEANAQCSGGSLAGNITPTTVTQTVVVPNGGTYFTFPGIAGVTYQFSFCPADGGSASWDTQITIIDNSTATYAGGYNDDWCGLQSYLQWVCPTSGTYRVLVSQFYCSTNGTSATLAYKLLPPPNDLCSGATSVNDPSVTVGNTTYASTDAALTCTVGDDPSPGVWYYVMGDGNQMTASLCGSAFDTRLRVFSGSCSAFVCEGGNDDFCGLQSQVTWCSVSGVTYYMLVYGNGGANGDFTLTMSETTVPPPNISQSASSYCGSGSIQIIASGSASTYSWSPPGGLNSTTNDTVIASPASTTTYTVTTSDPGTGCPAFGTATVTVNPIPVVTASTSSSTICGGGNVTLTAGGASTYNWMPGNLTGASVVVSPTVTTTYTVTGTSSLGCTNTATVTVNTYALPNVVATSSSPDICLNSFATLTASGASTYNWMPGNVTTASANFAPTTTTSYTLTGTDANGCVNRDTLTLIVDPLPTITATSSNDTVCTGNNDSLFAFGGSTYVWSTMQVGDTAIVSPNTATTYTVTGTDTNGCSNTGTVSLTVLLASPVTPTATYSSICIGSSTTLSASGAPNYTWMPGNLNTQSITVSPATTTTYTVSGYSTNGCVRTGTITITVNPIPTVTASASSSTVCSGSPTTITATGASTYSWSPGNQNTSAITVNPISNISFIVTGTDTNGCSDTALVSLNVLPAPNIQATASPANVCSGNPSTLTASGGLSYVWNPGNLTGTSVTVNPVTTTNYTVTGTDANGCTNTDIVPVGIVSGPNVLAYSSMSSVCTSDGLVTLNGIPAGPGGVWSGAGVVGSSFNPTIAGIGAHVVTYTYTDANGCSNSATCTIDVSACVGIAVNNGTDGINFFPNPNDGSFTINVSSGDVRNLKMEIIDLQGRLVYAEQIDGVTAGYTKAVDVSMIANGAYYIRFTSENSSTTQKLMIQK